MEKKVPNNDPVPPLVSGLVLLIAFALSATILYQQSSRIQQAVAMHAARTSTRRETLYHSPAAIESWMTFDYVNRIFHLPAGYLKSSLGVSDSRYPALTIHSYAKSTELGEADFLSKLRAEVASYKP